MKLTFLSSNVPLTKTYAKQPDGSIEKTSYPNVWQVSTHFKDAKDLKEMMAHLIAHGNAGHCLLKGNATRPLKDESRKGVTDPGAATDFLCLDFDGIGSTFEYTATVKDPITGQQNEQLFKIAVTPDVLMDALGLKDLSYILQWSGSQGIGSTDLRCHIFVHLSKTVAAPLIKQWLIMKNHTVDILKAHHALTKTGNSLTWGLDITACQADKLIYIAPPVLKGIGNPLGRVKRVALVQKTQDTFDITGEKINTTEQNRALTDARILELRDQAGLPKRKLQYKVSGPHQVLAKPDECIVTEMKSERGFVYFNLNGGDSWAYYHPEDNPDYIFNFKGEPVYLTKELLPSYWEQLQTQAYRTSSSGLTYLAFLERQTSAYWRGTYDAATDTLDVLPAKTESMIRQFADANGLRLGNNIPEWNMGFNPQDNVRVDFSNSTINTFQRSEYMKANPNPKVKTCPPVIMKVVSHVLAGDVDAIEHFMNWLAFIVQRRDRTRTGWIFQGTQGTGKGILMNRVLKPLFGSQQVAIKRAAELSEKWTDFVQGKLLVCIDEVQTSAYVDEHSIISNLKNLITEPTATIRLMNRNAFEVNNHSNWIFNSNKPDPVTVDKEDRRFNIGPYQSGKLQITQAEIDAIDAELQTFYHYLENFSLDEDLAATPLANEARSTLIELSQTTSETTADAVREGNLEFFIDQLPTGEAYKADIKSAAKVEAYRRALCDILRRTKIDGSCNVRRDELHVLFDYTVGGMSPSPATFTRFLGHKHIQIKPVSINGHAERGIQVVWQDHTQYLSLFKDMAKSNA